MNPENSFEQLEARIPDTSLDWDGDAMRRAGYRVVDWISDRIASLRETSLGRELSREETESLRLVEEFGREAEQRLKLSLSF